MECPTKSIPIDNLSLSVSNLSLSDKNLGNSVSEIQETVFNNSKHAAIPLYRQTIWNSIPGNKNQTFKGLNNEIPATDFSGDRETKAGDYAFLNLAITPEGSRKLQEIIIAGHSSVTSRLVESITSTISGIPLIYYLMTNPYGCHVCSKLFDCCNELQLGLLVENIAKDDEIFVNVSTNLHGAKLMKKLIKLLKGSSYYSSLIVLKILISFNRLMTNQTGSYVVNSCLDWLDINQNTTLYQAGISQCLVLATHVVGCIAMNYMIDKIQGIHRQQLLQLVAKNATFLSQDPSGNHVVQKVLDIENPICTAIIGSTLRGRYVKLSMHKWGSHVVEKCLNSQAGMEYGVEDFLNCRGSQLLQIAKDQFGNYVIQTALKVTKERNKLLHLRLVKSLNTNLSVLRFGYGKNIYNMVISEIHYSNVV